MKEAALVIIKPDGMKEKIIGHVFEKLARARLEMIGLKIVRPTKALAEDHYKEIQGTPFFRGTINYFIGKSHNQKKLISIVYYGTNAIKKLRAIAGATNPEEAHINSIRGAHGKITKAGVFENVVHVSSTREDGKREIKIWYSPDEITAKIYSSKYSKNTAKKERIWV
jgi:nucleoside-diphosphate kinase